ncbi:MAG: polysaccharide deacetylase family protein [Candidatus Saccharibacteria bacterium]
MFLTILTAAITVMLSFLPKPAALQTEGVQPSARSSAIYLTFDADMTEGMEERQKAGQVKTWYDPEIISFLEEQNISSTIFVTGIFAKSNPELIGKLAGNPLFELENHSYDHRAFLDNCYRLPAVRSDDDKKAEIVKTQDLLSRMSGKTPKFFRFPGLCSGSRDRELVEGLGLTPIGADIVSQDAFNGRPDAISERIIKNAKEGSVVLLHLGGPNAPATLQALESAVPQLKSRGFIFKTL